MRSVFRVSSVAIHKHLKALLDTHQILKYGKAPLVFYSLPAATAPRLAAKPSDSIDPEIQAFVEARYVYVSPTGDLIYGVKGFETWALGLHLEKQILPLLAEYKKIREEADRFFQPRPHLIEATEKLQNTFEKLHVDGVFYQDFYSLPKFGKTKLGAFVLYAKQSQHSGLIRNIATECVPALRDFIKTKSIDTVAFIPHSVPRKLQFVKEFEKHLNLSQQKIEIVKAYTGEIQVPQKSLSKLEERIVNARNTFFLKKNSVLAKNILLIDDAVGSGATMNEIAGKIRDAHRPNAIFGFAIVGSYKG
ncbi:MAG: hypothetical protein K8R69_10255, partial [Deltaproteobacteria bacterium]|nr:hypothetical protein [Deltaproteobacteria bacterium]